MKDPDINYDELEQHTYKDTPEKIFYICPKCGREYLDSFITEQNGDVMCIDCWEEYFG